MFDSSHFELMYNTATGDRITLMLTDRVLLQLQSLCSRLVCYKTFYCSAIPLCSVHNTSYRKCRTLPAFVYRFNFLIMKPYLNFAYSFIWACNAYGNNKPQLNILSQTLKTIPFLCIFHSNMHYFLPELLPWQIDPMIFPNFDKKSHLSWEPWRLPPAHI